VLFYQKTLGQERIVIAVSLNFHDPVQTELIFPFAAWNLPPGSRFVTEELFSGYRQEWFGDRHVITLNPAAQPALVWKLL
jgi:starch synthase (maltosyl-transferring)